MTQYTQPSIVQAQNAPSAQRMIAAQARLYSDVKRQSAIRFFLVLIIAVSISAISLLKMTDHAVGTIGGFALLFCQAFIEWRGRQKVAVAVSIQEQFDCTVYQIPWNEVLVRNRPSGQQIARAAERYTAICTANWYPDTGMVRRPLDVLICQQSNVGWGVPIHRAWAGSILAATIMFILALGGIWYVMSFDLAGGLDALVVPFLPVLWEAIAQMRANYLSAKSKEEVQQLMLADWRNALDGISAVTVERCRLYQDEIVNIRRTNSHIPNWFDRMLRTWSERWMRTTSQDMIEQARQRGLG